MRSPDLWRQPRLANVICAWSWRFCGIIPVVHVVEKAGGGAEPAWTLLRRRQWTLAPPPTSLYPVHYTDRATNLFCKILLYLCSCSVVRKRRRRSAVAVVTEEESGFDSIQWQEYFIFSKMARPAVGPAQSPHSVGTEDSCRGSKAAATWSLP